MSYFIPQPSTLATLEAHSRTTTKAAEKHIVLCDQSSRPIGSYHPIVGKAVHGELSRSEVSLGGAPDGVEQDRMTCENACRSWKELLAADQAFITAQATKWADATIVTISFSHIAGDAFTIKSIFKGWQNSLNHHPPAALQDLGKDGFIEYLPPNGSNSKDEQGKQVGLPPGWKKYGFIDKVRLISHLLWDLKVRRPEKTFAQYYIYLPEEKVQQLLAQAKEDLQPLASQHTNGVQDVEKQATAARDLNVSTFNVVFAWLLQNLHAANPKPKRKSSVLTIINCKTRPPAGHKPDDYPDHPVWGGAFGVPLDKLSSGDYATLPLGRVALHIRESVQKQIKPEAIRANIVMNLGHLQWKKPSGKLIFFAGPKDYWYGCTEWRSTKYAQIDLAAAVDKEKQQPGQLHPVAFNAHMTLPMSQRNRWVIFGDAGKGIWISGGMTHKEASHPQGFGRYPFVH